MYGIASCNKVSVLTFEIFLSNNTKCIAKPFLNKYLQNVFLPSCYYVKLQQKTYTTHILKIATSFDRNQFKLMD